MYIAGLAETYDQVYQGRGKNYSGEAADTVRHIHRHKPDATSLLDVACGTGSHLRHYGETFDRIEGVDISQDMLAVAKARLPDVPLTLGDLRDFDLGCTFDAVTCHFAIGHLGSAEELDRALGRLAAHVVEDGVVVVESWWFPENFTPGYVSAETFAEDDRTIARVSHSVLENDKVRTEVHCVVAHPGTRIQHSSQIFYLTLFTRAEYEAAFRRAGLTPTYIEGSPWECGLFVGVRR